MYAGAAAVVPATQSDIAKHACTTALMSVCMGGTLLTPLMITSCMLFHRILASWRHAAVSALLQRWEILNGSLGGVWYLERTLYSYSILAEFGKKRRSKKCMCPSRQRWLSNVQMTTQARGHLTCQVRQ